MRTTVLVQSHFQSSSFALFLLTSRHITGSLIRLHTTGQGFVKMFQFVIELDISGATSCSSRGVTPSGPALFDRSKFFEVFSTSSSESTLLESSPKLGIIS